MFEPENQCEFCGALRFAFETKLNVCCANGRVNVPLPPMFRHDADTPAYRALRSTSSRVNCSDAGSPRAPTRIPTRIQRRRRNLPRRRFLLCFAAAQDQGAAGTGRRRLPQENDTRLQQARLAMTQPFESTGWRMFGYGVHYDSHSVQELDVHLPDAHVLLILHKNDRPATAIGRRQQISIVTKAGQARHQRYNVAEKGQEREAARASGRATASCRRPCLALRGTCASCTAKQWRRCVISAARRCSSR